VLVVGDSLEVGTGPGLRRELGGLAVTVDARTGRPSGEGVGVLGSKLRPGHRVVVFDLGVNDDPARPGALASDLASARRLAGARCMVVATVERPPLNGVGVAGLNAAIKRFAEGDPNVQVVDWQGLVRRDRGLLNPDGVHPKPAGYTVRARAMAQGVQACLTGAAAPAHEPTRTPQAAPPEPAAPRRPLLIDWPALGRSAPVAGPLSALRGGLAAVAGAQARALAQLGPGGEPVLGGRP
jgi:hypothetical protein